MKRKLLCSLWGILLIGCMAFFMQIDAMADNIRIEDTENNVTYTLSEYVGGGYTANIEVGEGQTKLNVVTPVIDVEGNSYDIKNVAKISVSETMEEITFGEGIEVINASYFSDFAGYDMTVNFPSTIRRIDDGFVYAQGTYGNEPKVSTWLKNKAAENGVVYAGKVAIYVKEGVTNVFFKEDCTEIANGAAMGNKNITEVTINKSIKSIGGSAFSECTALNNVIFEEGTQIEDLDWRAFYDCRSLTVFHVPDSVTRIGTEVFAGCKSLETVNISKNSKLHLLEYGAFGYYPYVINLNDYGPNFGISVQGSLTPTNGAPIKEIYIPAAALHTYNTYSTAAGLFAGCTTLQKVTIGESDTKATIPFEAFADCTSLETVELGGNADNIQLGAFIGCTNLKSVNLDGVKTMLQFSFAKSGLTEITIPESVEQIGSHSFMGCTNLIVMNYNAVNSINYAGGTVKLLDILGLTSYYKGNYGYNIWDGSSQNSNPIRSAAQFRAMYPKHTALQQLNIGMVNGKTILDKGITFAGFVTSLEKVTIPEGVKVIPMGTFMCDYSLVSIDMPTSVTDINNLAFWGDVGVDIDFSKLVNLTNIGSCAFQIVNANGGNTSYDYTYMDSIQNGGISNIILPDSVRTVGSSAFFGQRNVKKLVIPEGVESVGSGAFQMIRNLEELEIYAPLNYIESSNFNYIFWNNRTTTLNKIVLGKKYIKGGEIGNGLLFGVAAKTIDIQAENIVNIGSSMFMNASNLTEFNIPKTVKKIECGAFINTTSLSAITIPENVNSMNIEAFRGSGISEITILNENIIIKEPAEEVLEGEEDFKTKVTLYGESKLEDYIAIPSNVTIIGYKGSTAEKYATEHGNNFVSLGCIVNVDGDITKVQEGETFKLPTDAEYGYFCDGKMYSGGSTVTVTSSMTFNAVNTIDIQVANGAAIKTSKPAGLKFRAKITTDNPEVVKSDAVTTGMLITPNDFYENNNMELDLTSNYKTLNIVNEGWADEETLTYYGAVANIAQANYTRDFVARAYATISYEDGLKVTYYSNVAEKRTVSYVASTVLEDTNNGLSEAELEVAGSFIK